MRLFFFINYSFPQKFGYLTLDFCIAICSKSTLGTISPTHSSSRVGTNNNSFIIFVLGCQVLLRQPFWFWISAPRWFSLKSLSSFPPSFQIFLASFQPSSFPPSICSSPLSSSLRLLSCLLSLAPCNADSQG